MVKPTKLEETGDKFAVAMHKGKADWDRELWKTLIATGRKTEPDSYDPIHEMTPKQAKILFVVWSEKFPYLFRQLHFDIYIAKYRLFDLIAMYVMSRTKQYGQPDEVENKAQLYAHELARLYIECAEKADGNKAKLYSLFITNIPQI